MVLNTYTYVYKIIAKRPSKENGVWESFVVK